MATLDEIFFKEFNRMMAELKGMNGMCNLNDIPLPPGAEKHLFIETRKKVNVIGINTEYYNKLNEHEALLWGGKALQRRKFDYKGEFIKDKNGNYVLEDVPCPTHCEAIISPISIGVPNKFRCKEDLKYVDMITRHTDKGDSHRYVYIIPRKYLYALKQTALILSWRKPRKLYAGVELAMQNGSRLYMSIIPYNPGLTSANYRVLHCKTSIDYEHEINVIKNFWIKNNIIFNPAWCGLDEPIKNRENMAYMALDATEDIYERFNSMKSMEQEDSIEEVDFLDE